MKLTAGQALLARLPVPLPGYVPRSDTAPDIAGRLGRGSVLVLTGGAGMGGWPCGKTQLAAQTARSLHEAGEVEVVAWVAASSRVSVLSGYASAAEVLGLGQGGAEQAAARFAGWLARTGQSWLLVLDDLRDPAAVEGLWPYGPAGRVLVTASCAEAVPEGSGAELLPVPAFSPREAVTIFTAQLSTDPDHRGGALDLVTELGGEPAALGHAAAVIADSTLTCRSYREAFTARREQPGHPDQPAAAVTWTLAAQHASLIAPRGTWPMLLLAAALDGSGIPVPVLVGEPACGYLREAAGFWFGPDEAWKVLLALEQTALVTIVRVAGATLIIVSAALQAAVRAAAGPGTAGHAACAAAGALAAAWPQPPEPASAAYLGCAVAVRAAAGDSELFGPAGAHPLLWKAGTSLAAGGMPLLAASWWRDLADSAARACGPRHPDTAEATARLAASLLTGGHAAEAAGWYQQLLEARAGLLGPDHPAVIGTRVSLGQALTACGKPGDARQILADAARAAAEVCGPAHAVTFTAREQLAAACLAAGDHRHAVIACRELLEARQQHDGPSAPPTLAAAGLLGDACLAAGQAEEAIGIYRQLASLADGTRAGLEAGGKLAAALIAAGQIADGLARYQRTSQDSERQLGAAHPATLGRCADLARACFSAGQVTTAISVLTAATARARDALPPGDPALAVLEEAMREMTGDQP